MNLFFMTAMPFCNTSSRQDDSAGKRKKLPRHAKNPAAAVLGAAPLLLLAAACATAAPGRQAGSPAGNLPAASDVADVVYTKYASTADACWNCHDPKIWQDDDGSYYVFSTGWDSGVQQRVSTDLVHWKRTDFALTRWDKEFRAWVGEKGGSWAPTIHKQQGKYYMYHGIITGAPPQLHAAITLAISDSVTGDFLPAVEADGAVYKNSTLVRYSWNNTLAGYESTENVASSPAPDGGAAVANWRTGFGAIDPEFVYDIATGDLVRYQVGKTSCYGLLYGSWKGGLALLFVDAATLKPVCTVAGTSRYDNRSYAVGDVMDAPADSISGNSGIRIAGGRGTAYEGAQLVYNSDTKRYYLFVSMGDLGYEYRVGLGRSEPVTAFTPQDVPTVFLDTSGRDMNAVDDTPDSPLYYHNVGAKIIGAQCLTGEYGFTAPGGLSVFRAKNGKILFANHARTNYMASWNFMLQIHQLFFNADGWPLLNQNDFYSDYAGLTADGTESLSPLSREEVIGSYDAILTERNSARGEIDSFDGTKKKFSLADGNVTYSKQLDFCADGSIQGAYTGSWNLASDGYSLTLALASKSGESLGTFTGYLLHGVDWARKRGQRRTITFTTVDGSGISGEYFWGNKRSASPVAADWVKSADSLTFTGTKALALTVPAFDVSAATGFTLQFTLDDSLSRYASDWQTQLLSYEGCNLTVANLDPWQSRLFADTLKEKNARPDSPGARLEEGYASDFAWNEKCRIGISFSKDAVVWYKNGKKVLTYGKDLWDGQGVGDYVACFATALQQGALLFNGGGMHVSDISFTKGAR